MRASYYPASMRRFSLAAVSTIAFSLLLSAPALAAKTGEGLVGETNDKVITYTSLGLIGFFVVFVILASAAQGRLEKRAAARKAARARQRVGW